ncbi:ParB/RepB/Spo0J family partition protein [Porphyromonadaceae bacterium W3.11]|nr:ParB/RepB/Spo0J family partition protein [Porphyromonadaceae bacterium W3.11]
MGKNSRRSLGRGLDALISTDVDIETQGSSSINEVPIQDITPNEDQPRTDFDEESLRELASSIEHIGLVQPITVYELPEKEGKYRIISGERRYRAAKLAGLETMPAYIRTPADEQIMEMALIENIQREDLNAIEIALAFKNLLDHNNLTQDELSRRVGKKRATISNYIRLLRLPAEIQMALKNGKISMGHARSLLSIEDPELQLAFYEQILKDALSVRQVEQLVKDYNQGDESTSDNRPKRRAKRTNEAFDLLSNRFSSLFDTKVSFTCNDEGKGKITIPFESADQMEKIISLLDRL